MRLSHAVPRSKHLNSSKPGLFGLKFAKDAFLKPSVWALIAANLFPVAGVLFFGWDTFLLLVLFWAENLVVGFYNVIKMALAGGGASPAEKFALIPFFIVHYGMFTMVHGIFVFVMFGGVTDEGADFSKFGEIGWGFVALLISHGVSLVTNYIQGGEYKRTDARMLMMAPYGRVVVLHLTIIASGFLMAFLGAPLAGCWSLSASRWRSTSAPTSRSTPAMSTRPPPRFPPARKTRPRYCVPACPVLKYLSAGPQEV